MSQTAERPANVRHDVANELAVIIGFSDLLLQEAEPDHAWRKDIEAIRLAAERATEMLALLKSRDT